MTSSVRHLLLLGAIAVASGCATRASLASNLPEPGPCRPLLSVASGAESPLEPPALSWHPGDADSTNALAHWCATVGPSVYMTAAAPQAPLPASPGELAIVSWNVHVGGGDLLEFIAALRSGAFTSGERVQHFVLLLQETFRSGHDIPPLLASRVDVPPRIAPGDAARRLNVLAVARETDLYVFYVPSMRNGDGSGRLAEDRGNAILSTVPLSALTAIELPYARQRRVAAAATISGISPDGHPWQLRVVSAHLDATAGVRSLWLFSSELRERQVAHLLEALNDDLPIVMGADLNTWAGGPREPAVVALQRAFPASEVTNDPTFRFGLILDYVFTRLPATWRSEATPLDTRFGSDHHPLLARIRPQQGTGRAR